MSNIVTGAAAPPLDVGRILSRSTGVIRDNIGLLALLALCLTFGPDALFAALGYVLQNGDGSAMLTQGQNLVQWITGLYFTSAVMHTTFADVAGERLTFRGAFANVTGVFRQMMGVSALTGIGIFLGLLAAIVPGLLLATRWAVAMPVAVAEGPGITKSLARSTELTAGHRWSILGVMAINLGVIGFYAATIIGLLLVTLPPIATMVIDVAAFPLLTSIVLIWINVAPAILYMELKRLKEGVEGDVNAIFA